MDSLVRALGRFATRDIPYVIGGSSIVLKRSLDLLDQGQEPDRYRRTAGARYPRR
jgi:hypothetical protein